MLDNDLDDYPAKSDPITSSSLLIFRSVSSRRTMLFHSICSFRHFCSILYTSALYLRACVLSNGPNFAPFASPFVRLSRIFATSFFGRRYQSPYYHPPSSLIFSPRTVISGRLSRLFLATFCFYLFLLLSSLSITGSLSIPPPHISAGPFYPVFSRPSSFRRAPNLNFISFFLSHSSPHLEFKITG